MMKNLHSKSTMNREIFDRFYTEHEQEMLMLFKQLVETNSYSYNHKGIKKCLDLFSQAASPFLKTTYLNNNCLQISNHNLDENYALFVGHMDTVFPESSRFQHFVTEGNLIKGPGTYDMKGGLIVALYALKFLHYLGILSNIPICFLINSDEETGSLSSKKNIQDLAKSAIFAFVFEGGGKNGEIVTARKGKIGLKGIAQGEAGHAAFIIENKKSAILEMAYKVINFEKLNNPIKNISCNVGKINGGTGANIVPDYCEVSIDIRYSCKNDTKELNEKIQTLIQENNVKGVEFKLVKISERPCMERKNNLELFTIVEKTCSDLNIKIKEEFRNGVSDANFIAETNTPVLDGLGPIGGNDHSDREFIFKDSLKDRIFLTANALTECYSYFIKKTLNS
ncbi:M20/M25/M40 family metallo-hydrolase [Deferribacter abyssi]|uniref:M20/M25/M40 family metallo-hydrolase n=1 Tax=Deferribacter abyssi TaxID=213806 RepID=UPI003C1E9707